MTDSISTYRFLTNYSTAKRACTSILRSTEITIARSVASHSSLFRWLHVGKLYIFLLLRAMRESFARYSTPSTPTTGNRSFGAICCCALVCALHRDAQSVALAQTGPNCARNCRLSISRVSARRRPGRVGVSQVAQREAVCRARGACCQSQSCRCRRRCDRVGKKETKNRAHANARACTIRRFCNISPQTDENKVHAAFSM